VALLDRVVAIGVPGKPDGSSGKIREQEGRRVLVDWGSGDETRHVLGHDVVLPRTAARRGVEPWASAFRR
jgi:hypothetical protein